MAELTSERVDSVAIAHFRAMRGTGFDAWHDGAGYPLATLDAMNTATREALVRELTVRDGREIEVLAALDLPSARLALRRAYEAAGKDRVEIGLALLRWRPTCLSEPERTHLVCQAIADARGGDGLDAALEAAQAWHPAPVIEAMWKALDSTDSVVVVHVAALLFHLHGLTAEAFDWALRPQFLCFASDDDVERQAARASLRAHMQRHPVS